MEIITGLNGGGWELARPSPSGRRRQVSRSQVQHIPGFVPGTAVDPLDRQGQRPSRVAHERRGAADGSYPSLAGGLDLEAPPKRPDLLLRIEHACRIREDEGVFSIIAA